MRQLAWVGVLSLVAIPAFGAAPALVPIQGYLSDSSGVAIDGDVSMHFAIYDSASAATPLWEETQSVLTQDGFFGAYLGQTAALPLSLFRDHGAAWLGVTVDGDSEMPRALLGSAPFAAYAEYGTGTGGGIVIQGSATADHLTKIVNAGALAETPLIELSGRLTNVNDPVGPQDAATKHYVDVSAGQPIYVYKSDNVTTLGRYLGVDSTLDVTCAGILYSDANGLVQRVGDRACEAYSTVYFTSATCTGTAYLYGGNSGDTVAWRLGADAWTATVGDRLCSSGGYTDYYHVDTNGVCSTTTSSLHCSYVSAIYSVQARLCGNAGKCRVR